MCESEGEERVKSARVVGECRVEKKRRRDEKRKRRNKKEI